MSELPLNDTSRFTNIRKSRLNALFSLESMAFTPPTPLQSSVGTNADLILSIRPQHGHASRTVLEVDLVIRNHFIHDQPEHSTFMQPLEDVDLEGGDRRYILPLVCGSASLPPAFREAGAGTAAPVGDTAVLSDILDCDCERG